MKKLLLLCLLLGVSIGAFAQVDTLSPITPPLRRSPFIRDMERITSSRAYRITYIGVPLVVAGLVVQERDHGFRHLRNDYVPSFRFRYDDYLQYAPAALMLGLKIGGVRGRSSWGRMLVSDAFSVALMAGAVNSLKYTCRMPRPDGSNNKSFPSGHTATAFMAATMLHKEYGGRQSLVQYRRLFDGYGDGCFAYVEQQALAQRRAGRCGDRHSWGICSPI